MLIKHLGWAVQIVATLLVGAVVYLIPLPSIAAQKRSLVDKLALFPLTADLSKPYFRNLTQENQVELKEASIPGPHGNNLAGVLLKKEGSKYIYLVNHGNGGDLSQLLNFARIVASTGQSVFLYDYEGYGRSQGTAKLANLVPDGCCVFDYLVQELGYRPDQIIVYGESIGTGPTAAIMSLRKPRAVVLQSGFTSLLDAGRHKLWVAKMLPSCLIREPHFDNLKAVEKPHPPLLFIHGDQDEVLPVRYSRKMFAEALEPKQYYESKGARHNDIWVSDSEGFRQALSKFVVSLDLVPESHG